MAKSKKKNMSYIPTVFTENIDVALGSYYAKFLSDSSNYFQIGNSFFKAHYEDETQEVSSDHLQNSQAVKTEVANYGGKSTRLYISPLDISLLSFDTNVSPNSAARIAALPNGDILIESSRVQVNGQLALNGEYQIGDKTITITNGIITNIV